MLFIGMALLVGGMAVSIGAPAEARDARVLAQRGVDTTATITDLTVHSHGRNSSRHAHADVEFHDEFGLSQESSDLSYCEDPDALAVGDEVTITYDPDEVAPPQFAQCPQSQAVIASRL